MSRITSEEIREVQDAQSLRGSLLVIQEALETGKWPKSFILYNDSWIDGVMTQIAQMLNARYDVEVPPSMLEA